MNQTVSTKADSLLTALQNAALFVSSPDRPALAHVRLSWDKSDLVAEATDSYAIVRESVFVCPEAGDDTWCVFVDKTAIASLTAFLKPLKAGNVFVSVDDQALTVKAGSSVASVPVAVVAYPNTAMLFEQFKPDAAPLVGLATFNLSRLGKVKVLGKKSSDMVGVKFELAGAFGASRFTIDNGRIIGLVMPVRMT